MNEVLLVERTDEGIATITLNRPERKNAISVALLERLTAVLDELSADESLRALILTGTDPAFCAGLDLYELEKGAQFRADAVDRLRDFPAPIIGAINGPAITGGLELALACDFRIASERAFFADTHSLVGVVPAWGLSARLPQAVGQSWARQMSFTGMFVDAATSCRIGLVNVVVEHGDLHEEARKQARGICATNRNTLHRLRKLYDATRDGTGQEVIAAERAMSRAGLAMDAPEDFARRRDAVIQRGRGLARQ